MRYLLFLVLLCFVLSAIAQKDGTADAVSNGQLWNEVNLTHAHKKMVYQLDLLLNFSNDTADQYQLSKHMVNWGIRGWANYYITPRIKLGTVLSYQYNTNTPEVYQSAGKDIQQSFFVQHFVLRKRITIYNRLRFDNRFLENPTQNKWDYTARLRYMPKVVLTLNSNIIRKKSLYFLAQDEIFMPFGKGPFINMNMLQVGFGYCFTGDIILEVCYNHQYKKRVDLPSEITNALGLTLSLNNFLSIVKKKN